ncbi:TfoX/Sxy family protein [Nioella sp. MMSF_3534]|uniref:TfoX/Sxy family protein n=1 Tax=Nioella sp. MMSF_3534 TaxID=3046720 RepID=UPI00273F41E7|nr:TfoX/Sxy family protein [Nioella sp. MMSF_3534]
MPTPLTEIRNIGPAMAEDLKRAGIPDAESLRRAGPDAAYAAMLRAGSRPHFIAYYVLHMGLQGRPWNDCQGDEKAALRRRFDQIKAECVDADRSAFEAMMNELGVGARR